jgi:hypothetical protein
VREAASTASDTAGDGTTTATARAYTIVSKAPKWLTLA